MTKFYRYLFTRSELRGIVILSFGVILIRVVAYAIEPAVNHLPAGNRYSSVTDSSGQVKKKPRLIEINSADSAELDELPGIGLVFAKRIIKYREMLGGYVHASQLREVYGMDSVRFSGFVKLIRIDTSGIRKLDLNRATFKELLAHPYLEYDQVKEIVRYRDKKGQLTSPGQLWSAGIIADSLKGRLSHYLIAVSDSFSKGGKVLVK